MVLAANPTISGSAIGNNLPIDNQQSAIQQRLTELQAEATRLSREERTLLNELRQLEIDRSLRAAELDARTIALQQSEGALAALEIEQAALAATIERQRPLVRARVVELYKRGRASDLRRLVDAASARDAMRAWRQMGAASAQDAARFAAHRDANVRLAAARAQLSAEREEAARLRAEAGTARAALDRSIARHERRVAAIDRERDLNAALTGELQAAAAGLAATVDALPPSSTPPNPSNLPNLSNPSNLPITAFRGALPRPAAGRVVRPFRASAQGALPFNGIEIAVAEGAPVTAVHGGDVAFSGPFTGFGHLIIVQHGPQTFTLYGHLSSGSVAKGDRVSAGQIIGRAGRPPAARDSRLYFELRIDGQPVDPLQWFRLP
jgi:septal ring factor EnvC (AmiA/AmiB activator)